MSPPLQKPNLEHNLSWGSTYDVGLLDMDTRQKHDNDDSDGDFDDAEELNKKLMARTQKKNE